MLELLDHTCMLLLAHVTIAYQLGHMRKPRSATGRAHHSHCFNNLPGNLHCTAGCNESSATTQEASNLRGKPWHRAGHCLGTLSLEIRSGTTKLVNSGFAVGPGHLLQAQSACTQVVVASVAAHSRGASHPVGSSHVCTSLHQCGCMCRERRGHV